MKLIKLTAPLTALTLLTGACGPAKETSRPAPNDPIPKVTGHGPGLQRVWQIPRGAVKVAGSNFNFPTAVGNVVVAQDPKKSDGLVFIDATTGRVTGRVSGFTQVTELHAYPAVDARGHPLVQLDLGPNVSGLPSVYDPTGRLVWRARDKDEQFVGGYVATTRETGKADKMVIRTLSGRVVGRVTAPSISDDQTGAGPTDLQLVRPGWLVVSRNPAQVDLIDVTGPGQAKVKPLVRPAAYASLYPPRVTVGNGHVYVGWPPDDADEHAPVPLAGYVPPRTRPVWHRHAPDDVRKVREFRFYPGPNGNGTVELNKGWFLRPDNGALISTRSDPPALEPELTVYGRYEYKPPKYASGGTRVIDLHTRKKRAINAVVAGIASNGYLIIPGDHTLSAYRWK